jgi:triphosphoribosyl-dephospho-CoA synthase
MSAVATTRRPDLGVRGTKQRLIENAFVDACLLDVFAFKPGNVGVHAPGHGMQALDFIRSARVAAPAIAADTLAVGERISQAIAATYAEVGINTNLGIVLLAAPLARAVHCARAPLSQSALHDSLGRVLADLTISDAAHAFDAICLANPAGLGAASRHDVRARPVATLVEAMQEAADRDRIARQYVTAYEDIVHTGLRRLSRAVARGRDQRAGVTEVFLAFASAFPDTHVERKFGLQTAQALQREAREYLAAADQSGDWDTLLPALRAWDRDLKARGINPGTSADLTVGTMFWSLLLE